jgi:hypothetical protein
MKKDFEQSNLPPVVFYIGDAVMHEGELKLEWNDPGHGKQHYTEEQLSMIERSSRDMLIHRHEEVVEHWGGWTAECHAYFRDRHYNAEYGLARLQEAKMAKNLPLTLAHRPVIR